MNSILGIFENDAYSQFPSWKTRNSHEVVVRESTTVGEHHIMRHNTFHAVLATNALLPIRTSFYVVTFGGNDGLSTPAVSSTGFDFLFGNRSGTSNPSVSSSVSQDLHRERHSTKYAKTVFAAGGNVELNSHLIKPSRDEQEASVLVQQSDGEAPTMNPEDCRNCKYGIKMRCPATTKSLYEEDLGPSRYDGSFDVFRTVKLSFWMYVAAGAITGAIVGLTLKEAAAAAKQLEDLRAAAALQKTTDQADEYLKRFRDRIRMEGDPKRRANLMTQYKKAKKAIAKKGGRIVDLKGIKQDIRGGGKGGQPVGDRKDGKGEKGATEIKPLESKVDEKTKEEKKNAAKGGKGGDKAGSPPGKGKAGSPLGKSLSGKGKD